MIGYNYRMPNINAALGCAQLEKLPEFLEIKRQLANRYQTLFSTINGVQMVVEPDFAQSNYWLNAMLVAPEHADKRDELLALTNDCGIMTRPVWNLMYTLPMFTHCPQMDCPVAESLAARLINIPSSVNL